MVVAIDGPSGAGKSTVARLLAGRLGFLYVDTGAMYRAVALKAKRAGLDLRDEHGMGELCRFLEIDFLRDEEGIRVICSGEDVTDLIRSPSISLLASEISRISAVRQSLAELQRGFGRRGGVVLEGRDIGTVVFPEADVKFFLDADPSVRARRRYEELKARGEDVELEETIREMERRDYNDRTRALAPLRAAPDAVLIDSTHLSVDEVVEMMADIFREKAEKR
ncbi:MAG: (d)CMP kinase [Deltaproteobacteria bacterium]|nr:(d)CMP kinase [Deltaproteobacteria bacterium]MBW2120692.1 (d)CMP kinase [Deltaproteobacteria bacterium]